jgi:hypothetical protein
MANIWVGDPNIISVWKFESGALTTDSVGTNTLTAVNSPAEDVVDYKEGTCCTSLAFASKRFFKITDANLSAGFPLKSGDAVQRISMGCWFKLTTTGGNIPAIIGKDTYAGLGLALYHNAGSLRVSWNATALTLVTISTDVWYHAAVMADSRARTCWVRLYDSSTGISTNYLTAPPAADITLTSEWRIGAWSGTDADRTFDGKIDEVFVFNRLLSIAEIDAIRNGSYEYAAASSISANDYTRDRSCVSVYHFESGALTTDAKALINLTASATAPVAKTTDFKVGSGCAEFNYRDNSYYSITEANLPQQWPMKSGTGQRTFTVCCWIKGFDFGTTTRTIWSKYLSTGNAYTFLSYISNVDQCFRFVVGQGSASTTIVVTSIPYYPNEWYHVSMSADYGGYEKVGILRVYRASTNTVSVYVHNMPGYWLTTTGAGDFRIGTNHQAPTENWNGLIDEFVVFNRFLGVEEVDAIRSGTYKGPISCDTPTMASNISTPLTFAQTVNNPKLTFAHGGDAVWIVENNETHDGSFSAKSGTITINKESWFTATVKGPGTLIFWWAVDSTADHHYLGFQIDGAEQHRISGPNNPGAWAKKVYSITAGSHVLKWRYYTDGSATSNRNAGYVDEISFGYVNDFTGDSACKALYKFESGLDLGYDSISTNHLRCSNNPMKNTWRYKEGSQCIDFGKQGLGATYQYMTTVDGSLSAGFPLKNDDTTRTGTYCFWIMFSTLSTYTYYNIIAKGSLTNRAFSVYYYNGIYTNWGYSGGNSSVVWTSALSTFRWYHMSISFDGVNKKTYMRIWDDDAQQIICDQVTTWANAMIATADSFMVGAWSGDTVYLFAQMDELAIFNRQLPIAQMDAIRKGLFTGTGPAALTNDFTGDSSCKALYKFEVGALTTDTISTNTLTDHSTVSVTDTVREGSGCVKTANSAATWLHRADADLAAGFPLKVGDANKVISICCWFRPLDFGNYRSLIAKGSGAANKGSFSVYLDASNRLYISYVYGSGTITSQDYQIGIAMVASTWYHIGLTIDGVNRKVTWRLYCASPETCTYGEFYPGYEMRIADADWTIGCGQGATTGTASNAFYGYIDEVVVFNRLLNILEIDAIRQGTYSGTSREGIVTDHISAQVAYRTVDRQTYFCVDPEIGVEGILNDGLSYQRPWKTQKGKFFAPGDAITFPQSDQYVQAGTVTVTKDSMSVQTTANLMGTLKLHDLITFGTDNVIYAVNTITSSTITLWRPYRGSTASGVLLYKFRGVTHTDWRSWNTGNYRGYYDLRIRILCGVNRITGSQDGWSTFDFLTNYPVEDDEPYFYYSRYAGYNSTGYGFVVTNSAGNMYEDMYFGFNHWVDFIGVQGIWNRIVCEDKAYFRFNEGSNCEINDLEMFSNHDYNLFLTSVNDIILNRFKTGNSTNAFYIAGPLRNVVFNNPVFGEGVDHTRLIYMYTSSQYHLENLVFVNAKLNPNTPIYSAYYANQSLVGELSFEHYNQTKDDHRTYFFNGMPNSLHAGVMYRDAAAFKTSSPSARIELTGGSVFPIIQKFLVPGSVGVSTTISCYVKFNAAYLKGVYTLPKMVVRTISGTIPNYIWVDTISTVTATVDTWLLLTQAVVPSINSIIEVFLHFQSTSPSAQVWFDDIDVVVPE